MTIKPKQLIYKVSATATLDGAEIPLSSFAVSYGVNSVPTAQIRPALGDKAFNSKLKFSLKESYSGKPVVIKMTYGSKKYLMFSGYVSGVSAARTEQENRSAGLVTINAVHTSAALAGLPAMERLTLNSGGGVSGSYDIYKDQGPESVARIWSRDAGLGDTTTWPDDIAKFTLSAIRALYNTEKARSDKNGVAQQMFRVVDKQATSELDKITTPCDMSFPQDIKNAVASVKASLIRDLSMGWMDSNGLTLMIRSMAEKHGIVSPVCDRLSLLPNFSYHAEYARVIESSKIFGVQRTTGVDPIKVGGVVIPVNVSTSDRQAKATSLVFSPDIPDGQLVYVNMPIWASIPGAKMMLLKDPPPETRARGSPSSAAGTIMRALEDNNAFPNIVKWHKAMAQAEFGMRAWSRDQLTLSVAFMPDLWIGEPLLVDIKDSKVSFQSRLVGMVASVSVGVAHGSFDMSVTLSGVRSTQDNDNKAYKELPLYPKAKPSDVNLKLFSIA